MHLLSTISCTSQHQSDLLKLRYFVRSLNAVTKYRPSSRIFCKWCGFSLKYCKSDNCSTTKSGNITSASVPVILEFQQDCLIIESIVLLIATLTYKSPIFPHYENEFQYMNKNDDSYQNYSSDVLPIFIDISCACLTNKKVESN